MTGLEQVLAEAGLHERERLLETLLQAYRGAGSSEVAVLLTGDAGCGKTSLLDVLAGLVARDGGAVLRATCSPLEVDFPFAVVQQLLGPSARPAPVTQPFAVLDGLYWELVARAEDGPALLLVDDVHWADDPSLRWLHYVLRRLAGLPVLPVLATRPAVVTRPLLVALPTLPGVREVPVPPLSADAAARLLRARVGQGLAQETAARCHEVTGGNPLYLTAVAVALREQGPARVEAALSERAAPLPEVVSRAVLDRLLALGDDAVAVVRAVAVLGTDAQPHLVSGLAQLCGPRLQTAISVAQEAGLLRAGTPLSVQHPIVRDAVYEQLSEEQRTLLHREAARRLAGAGAEQERVALHLVVTAPGDDIWVVESLLAAARRAAERGAPETAARYLRRALAEPLARRSPLLLLELGRAELLAGDRAASQHLREALELAEDDAGVVAAATSLARALVYRGQIPQAVTALRQARARLGDAASTPAAVVLDLEAVNAGHLDARTVEQAWALLAAYRGWGEHQPHARLVRAHLSFEPARQGRSAAQAVALAREALAGGELLAEQGAEAQSTYLPVLALLLSDAVDEARAQLDAAVEQGREHASVLGFCLASAWRSHAALRAGDVVAAGADAEATLAAADSAGLQVLTPYGVAFLSDVLLERGELDAADALWRRHGMDGDLPWVLPSNHLLFSRGALRFAQGRAAEAVEDLLAAGERQRTWRSPGVGFFPWASRAALALQALDETERAHRLVEGEVAAARAFGAPRALGIALHAAALLDRGHARVQRLEEAVEVLGTSPARLEQARALVDLGSALLRCGRVPPGRAALEDGLRRAVVCGAAALSARARDELHAAGLAPRRGVAGGIEALTISERRVAQLAASGSTNRQIAQALFVTPKTVETHLARAFRKLGITSRRELCDVPELRPDAR